MSRGTPARSRYASMIEVVRFYATTGATTIVSSTQCQVLKEIRRPYRVIRASVQVVLTTAPSTAAVQVRILDTAGAGIANSQHTLLGPNPRRVTAAATPTQPFMSPDKIYDLVAVDAVCYGTATKMACLLNITIQFQRMEAAIDACVTLQAELVTMPHAVVEEPTETDEDRLSRSFSQLSLVG